MTFFTFLLNLKRGNGIGIKCNNSGNLLSSGYWSQDIQWTFAENSAGYQFWEQKCYLLGDYNINLLNVDKHNDTDEFLYMLYSHSLFPDITKLNRIYV